MKRALLGYLLTTLLLVSDFAQAQPAKIPHIGFQLDVPVSTAAARIEAFRKGLRELVVNLKAAKQIGLTIPPNVLARADRVIK